MYLSTALSFYLLFNHSSILTEAQKTPLKQYGPLETVWVDSQFESLKSPVFQIVKFVEVGKK